MSTFTLVSKFPTNYSHFECVGFESDVQDTADVDGHLDPQLSFDRMVILFENRIFLLKFGTSPLMVIASKFKLKICLSQRDLMLRV